MTVKNLTSDQIAALLNQRAASCGVLYPAKGHTPAHEWLINEIFLIASALNPVSMGLVLADDANATTVRVMPGRFAINGVVLAYAGGTVDLAAANNKTSNLWVYNNAGAATIGHATSIADGGSGFPSGTRHIKLADVTLSTGVITTILDRRGESILSDAAQAATTISAGVVKQAAAIAANATSISNPPTQADVQSLQNTLNALIAGHKTAGQMAS